MHQLTATIIALTALLLGLPALGSNDLADANKIQDMYGSPIAKEFGAALMDRLGETQVNALPNYQFTNHNDFIEINAVDPALFTSDYIDNKLYNEVIDALNEWYGTSGQDPDFVVFYKAWDPASYGAFYSPLANNTRGIGYKHLGGPETFDGTGDLKLSGLIWMSALSQYNYGGNSRLVLNAFWGQELDHRWGAFVRYDRDGVMSRGLLGRDDAHWSYFMDSDWSCMEGNDWADIGDGQFQTNNGTFSGAPSYNALDLYLMGLIPHSAVPDQLIIENPVGTNRNATSAPEMPFGGAVINVTGTRRTVTMEDILTIEGPRSPWWTEERRNYKVAMFVLSRNGAQMSATQISRSENYAKWMQEDFAFNTRYLAALDMETGTSPINQPPKAAINAPATVKKGQAVTLDALGSTDPEGSDLAYVWEFGDDTADFTSGASVEKTWKSTGTFTVTLMAVDRSGGLNFTSTEVTVEKGADGGGCSCSLNDSSSTPVTGLLLGLFGVVAVLMRRRRR